MIYGFFVTKKSIREIMDGMMGWDDYLKRIIDKGLKKMDVGPGFLFLSDSPTWNGRIAIKNELIFCVPTLVKLACMHHALWWIGDD